VNQIQVDRVLVGKFEIEPVEHVLFIAVIVEDLVLGAVEETACVQTADGDEIPPLLAAIGEIKTAVGTAERPVRSGYVTVGW